MKNILNYKNFLKEELNIYNLDLRTKKEIIANLKLRLLELKLSWRLDSYTELSILDIRNIVRQFNNEFGEDLMSELEFKKFLEEASSLFPNKQEVIRLINKFIQKIDSL